MYVSFLSWLWDRCGVALKGILGQVLQLLLLEEVLIAEVLFAVAQFTPVPSLTLAPLRFWRRELQRASCCWRRWLPCFAGSRCGSRSRRSVPGHSLAVLPLDWREGRPRRVLALPA